MKKDLTDVTFLLYIRPDSIIRIENLIMCISFLKDSFITNIKVIESASYDNSIIRTLIGTDVEYYFVEDKDPVFHRTKYYNILTEKALTPYIGLWDADSIVDIKQVMEAISALRKGRADVALAYNGTALDTSPVIRSLFYMKKDIKVFHENAKKMELVYGTNLNGGALLINLEKYKQAGKECIDYYGWGREDDDRFARYEKLDYRIFKADGYLYHLSHPRDENGWFRNPFQFRKSTAILNRRRESTREEILKEILS